MANVVVTGGAGFIGSHVAEACLEAGDSVWVADNLTSGLVEDVAPGAVFCEGDVADVSFMRRVVEEAQPGVIHHLAAQSSVTNSLADPLCDARANILGTLSIHEAARNMDVVPRVVYAATGGACYGDPEEEIVDESHPLAPVSHYGMSKVAGERYLAFYGEHFGLPVVSLRLANVYGPRQRPTLDAGVVSIFAEKLDKGEPLTLYGHGRAGRDYVYVEDVAAAFLRAAQGGVDGGAYNIGTGVVTDVEALLDILCRLMGKTPVSVKRAPLRPSEVFRIGLDASAFERGTGWRPRCTLEEGVGAFLESLEA